MTGNQIFSWIDGEGWLILSGGADALGEVRATALTRMRAEGGVAYVGLDEQVDENLIDDFGDLGAPTGYLVDVMTEDDDAIREQIRAAALVVIPGGARFDQGQSMVAHLEEIATLIHAALAGQRSPAAAP